MAKATLEFDLPGEREKFETTIKASDYKACLMDIGRTLRNMKKKDDPYTIDSILDMYYSNLKYHRIEDE